MITAHLLQVYLRMKMIRWLDFALCYGTVLDGGRLIPENLKCLPLDIWDRQNSKNRLFTPPPPPLAQYSSKQPTDLS